MRLLFDFGGGKLVSFDRFLTRTFGTNPQNAAWTLNQILQQGHSTFEPHGDDVTLRLTEEGSNWVAEHARDDPGAVAEADQAHAELRDSADDDES